MNKNIATIGGVLGILIIGGLVLYSVRNSQVSPSDNTSPTDNGVNNNVTSGTIINKVGSPVPVTNSKVVTTDTTSIVTGNISPNGSFTNYWFEYGTTPNLGYKTESQLIGSGYVSIPSPGYIIGLAKDTTYYFRLVAENEYGRVAGMQYSFKTTLGNPPPVGGAPVVKTFSANSILRTTANLNGEVNPNKAITQYWFEYGNSTNLGNTTEFMSIGDGDKNIRASISLSDLAPDTTYYFRLNAQNQFNTVNGQILNFKTLGPATINSPSVATHSATNIKTTNATLNATVSPNGAETKYWFEYSPDSLFGSVLVKTTSKTIVSANENTLSAKTDISNLKSNTTYYFRIIAENSKGTVKGDPTSFKTK